MIVIDTSALAAIILEETDAEYFLNILLSDKSAIAAPTAFEFVMVASGRKGRMAHQVAINLLAAWEVEVVAWQPHHVAIASQAFVRFGKGSHPAKLNLGDCMSYALAKSLDAPLLFKGNDFSQTDIIAAA